MVSWEAKSNSSRLGSVWYYQKLGCVVPEDGIQKDYYYYSDLRRQRESLDGRLRFGAGTEEG